MRTHSKSLLLLSLACLCCGRQEANDQSPNQTAAEVQALVRSIGDAVGKGDAGRTMDFYRRNDASISSASDGELQRGWQQISASTDSSMGLEGKYRLSLGTVDVKPLGREYALAVVPVLVTVPTQTSGDVQIHGVWSIVARHDSTGWKVIHDHTSYKKPEAPKRQ